jgi:hypothetical protein
MGLKEIFINRPSEEFRVYEAIPFVGASTYLIRNAKTIEFGSFKKSFPSMAREAFLVLYATAFFVLAIHNYSSDFKREAEHEFRIRQIER